MAVFDEKLFVTHYQPIIDVVNKKIIGVEAFLRYEGNKYSGSILELIHDMEELCILDRVTEKVILLASNDIRRLPVNVWISVNVSPSYIESGQLYSFLKGNNKTFPAKRFIFELTEAKVYGCVASLSAEIRKIERLGYRFKIDDFGTGFNSLLNMQELEVYDVKIDKLFVDKIGCNSKVLDAVLQLVASLGCKAIAEGVETEEQIKYLTKRGVSLIQGYYYSPAISIDALCEYISSGYSLAMDR